MANATLVNFAAGETSPKSRGRFDIGSYLSSCRKLENFIPDVQGSVRYRPGFRHLDATYKNAVARLIPYQISEDVAFMLEFTPNRLRIFENEVPVAQEAAGLDPTASYTPSSSIVQVGRAVTWRSSRGEIYFYTDTIETGALANPITITVNNSAVGEPLLVIADDPNNVVVWLTTVSANNTASAIQALLRAANPLYANWRVAESPEWAANRIKPPAPAISSSTDRGNTIRRFAAKTSVAGSAANTIQYPYEIRGLTEGPFPQVDPYWSSEDGYVLTTPYLEDDLPFIHTAQTPDTMYVAHRRHAPRKLARDSAGRWTLATYSRTNDPLVAGAAVNINAITLSAEGVLVGFASAPILYADQLYAFASIVGTTQLNSNSYYLEIDYAPPVGITRAWLIDPLTGERLSSTGLSAYTSGGTATPAADNPIALALYEGRLFFLGTNRRPRTVFGSRSPAPTTGSARLDDFTGGTDPDHAVFFTLSPLNGVADYIVWGGGTTKHLIVGTFGGIFRVSGGGVEEPITPSSIAARPVDRYGCSALPPAFDGAGVYYIPRDQSAVRRIQYAEVSDDLVSVDLCLNAEQIGYSTLQRIVPHTSKQDFIWTVRTDGQIAGCTVDGIEQVTGWHRHKLGGTAAKALDVSVLPRSGARDQLYIVSERTIDGETSRAIEILAEDSVFPDPEDYFTGEGNEAADAASYAAAVTALQKTVAHLDAYEYYSGDPATTISGLHHLEGETVTALADGVVVENLTVTNGAITLPTAASVVVVGLPYTGLLQTQNLEVNASGTGPAQAKPRNICKLNIRFLNSLGCEYGTDLYHLEDVYDDTGRVFSGIKELHNSDSWLTPTREKTVYIVQQTPLPCVVQFIDMEFATGED